MESSQIVFVYGEIQEAIKEINRIAGEYEKAAKAFKSGMNNATQAWSGASKNKFMNLCDTSVYEHFYTSIPETVRGMAALLSNNADAMCTADTEVANSMPDSL